MLWHITVKFQYWACTACGARRKGSWKIYMQIWVHFFSMDCTSLLNISEAVLKIFCCCLFRITEQSNETLLAVKYNVDVIWTAQPTKYGLSYYFSQLSRIKTWTLKISEETVLFFVFLIICSVTCIGTRNFNFTIPKELPWDSDIWELD